MTIAYVQEEIKAKVSQVLSDLSTIENCSSNASASKLCYMDTLNLGEALEYAKRLEKVAEPDAAPVEEEEVEPEWYTFEALLTPHTAKLLNGFCKLNGIKIRKPNKED